MKTVRKILFYIFLVIGVLLVALSGSAYLFKDKIINQFIREANKNLNTPVKPGKIDISWYEDFPNLSIVFNDVYIEDSQSGEYPLLTAKVISFQLNPIEVWRGKYTVKGLHIIDSETNLKIDAKGNANYIILKKNVDSSGETAVTFELKNVKLENARVRYHDQKANQDHIFTSKQLTASIHSSNDIYDIEANGEISSEKIKVGKIEVFKNKSFTVSSSLVYDDVKKIVTIKPSELTLKNSTFNVEGEYKWKTKSLINLTATGKNTDIQTIFSLLPESIAKGFEKYQSNGDIYFNARLKGEMSKTNSPSLSVDFGFTNATLFHPDYQSRIEEAAVEGSFASARIVDEQAAVLILKNLKGKLNNEPFQANLIINNFKDSDVSLDFKGKLDAAAVFGFYPVENIKKITGNLLADISFKGRLSWLKSKATASQVSTQGSVDLQNIELLYGKEKIHVKGLSGGLQFNNNDLALSNVSAKLGNSDFLLNGFFKNIITFLLFEGQPIGIETDLKSNFLDLDELFAISFGTGNEGRSHEYEFTISPSIHLNFNCDVKALRYKRFHARKIKGDLLVKNEVAVSRNVHLYSMGGDMTLSGIVDAKNHKAIDVVSTCKLNGIQVDSLFHVFENFHQDFIKDNHLKGQAYADVNMEMVLKPTLKLFPETLIADVSAIVKNGELNNFEPLQKLGKYIDDGGLHKVRFSDLKNEIHIENKTVYIPQMEVRTNVTNLRISGTHTFDQHIDYRVIAPLRSLKKISFLDAQGAMEEDGAGKTKLFLKIVGTTDDYRIMYDTEAVKKKIVSDLKREVQELKSAFKNKGMKKQKEIELQKDEYFEWE